jgi:hypothetical protein
VIATTPALVESVQIRSSLGENDREDEDVRDVKDVKDEPELEVNMNWASLSSNPAVPVCLQSHDGYYLTARHTPSQSTDSEDDIHIYTVLITLAQSKASSIFTCSIAASTAAL